MKKLTVKPINYEKVKEVQQGQDENSAVFQRILEEVFRKYTNVDLSSPEGWVLLTMHLIAQSAPDIRHKIQKATAGLQIPMSNLLQLTYLVVNNRDMAKKAECTLRDMQKAQMIAMALSTQRPPTESLVFLGQSDSGRPQGLWVSIKPQCSLCGQKGHWGKDYS